MPVKTKQKSNPSKTGKKSTVKKSSALKGRKKETKIAAKKKVIAPKVKKAKMKIEPVSNMSGVLEPEHDITKVEAGPEITAHDNYEKQDNWVREEIVPTPIDQETIVNAGIEKQDELTGEEITSSPVDNIGADVDTNNEQEFKKDENLTDAEIQLVCFTINFEEFGVDISDVKEINRSAQVTHIVDAPVHVKGVIDLRGSIIPVIDLRTLMGYPEQEDDKHSRIIVLDNDGTLAGIKVDGVTEVIRLRKSQVEKAPEKAKTQASKFLKGIFKKEDNLILIIDGQKLI